MMRGSTLRTSGRRRQPSSAPRCALKEHPQAELTCAARQPYEGPFGQRAGRVVSRNKLKQPGNGRPHEQPDIVFNAFVHARTRGSHGRAEAQDARATEHVTA